MLNEDTFSNAFCSVCDDRYEYVEYFTVVIVLHLTFVVKTRIGQWSAIKAYLRFIGSHCIFNYSITSIKGYYWWRTIQSWILKTITWIDYEYIFIVLPTIHAHAYVVFVVMLSSHGGVSMGYCKEDHDDVIHWKHFLRYWPFVRIIHRSPVNAPHNGQWRGTLMLSLNCAWINGWVNNREAGDLRRHRAHYGVIVMRNSIANALELRLSCTNPSVWWFIYSKSSTLLLHII